MLIVDTNTEYHLTAMSETWRTNAEEHGRVVVVERAMLPSPGLPIQELCNFFTSLVKDKECKALVCMDGDVFFITTQEHLPYEQFKKFLMLVGSAIRSDASTYIRVYDTGRDLHPLRLLIRQKSDNAGQARLEIEELKQRMAEENKQRVQELQRQNILNQQFDAQSLSSLQDRRNQRKQVEILIVEDDRFTQQLVQNSLRKSFNVSGAENGADALTSYILNPPDIVFLDINLPDIEGFDVLHKILSFDPESYIVMLSGNADRDNIMRALQDGAKGFIGKPFTPKKLAEYIEKSPLVRKHLSTIPSF